MDLSDQSQTLVIIGNGMVGWKLCQRMVEYGANDEIRILVFGEEPFPAYDRVHLTEYFAGRPLSTFSLAPPNWYEQNRIELFLGDPIVEVDREQSVVRSRSGLRVEYNRLVFATGSRPFVPPIEGADLPGVFVYRTLDDVADIEEYACDFAPIKSAAVIGGGLLGLEAAKAVFDLELDVHVVEVSSYLMPRQLDAEGGAVLRDKVERMGVKIRCGKKLLRIEEVTLDPPGEAYGAAASYRAPTPDAVVSEIGPPMGLRLHFDDGETLLVGMVVFAAGVRPRGELAKVAGLQMAGDGGIVVDDRLQAIDRKTRHPDEQIFAVGECASHRGTTYGLVLPGYQMVDVLAANLLGAERKFEGADISAKLKLMGVTVAALGEHDGDQRLGGNALVFNGGGVYRKLVIRDGRLIGAVTVGEWENLDRIRELLKAPLPLSFWDMRRFRGTGNLWPKSESSPVADWPAEAIVCGCVRVTRGALALAIEGGCSSVEALGTKTGAGTLCGSCKPLLSELLGQDGPVSVFEPMPASWREGPRSRRGDGGPRSRRGEGPRSRRGGELSPSSRLDSSQRTSVMPPSSLATVPSSSLDSDAPRSRRDGMPSSLETLAGIELAPPSVRDIAPPSHRFSITITARPPELPIAHGFGARNAAPLAPLAPAPAFDDADIEPAPMSVRGPMIHAPAEDDADAGPASMRSASLATHLAVDLPPPSTLRSSIPPPSSVDVPQAANFRASSFEVKDAPEEAPVARRGVALASETPPAGTEIAPRSDATLVDTRADLAPRSDATLVEVPPREPMKTPPTGTEIAPRSSRLSLEPAPRVDAAPTPPTGMPVVPRSARSFEVQAPASVRASSLTPASGIAITPRSPVRTATPPAGIALIGLGGEALPPALPQTPATGLVLGLAARATAEGPIRRSTPPAGSVRVVSVAPPPPSSQAAPSSSRLLPPSSASPTSSRPLSSGVILPPLDVAILSVDEPLPRLAPLPVIESTLFSASDVPPSSTRRLSAMEGLIDTEDRKESSSTRYSRISLLAGVEEGEITDSLSVPRDGLTPGLTPSVPPVDRAPMSRRSWVPPKRLSMPPGALQTPSMPPVRPSIAAPIQAPPERGRKILLVASAVALSWVLVLALAPSLAPPRSVRTGFFLDALLRPGVAKQVTGYALVALAVASLGVSLRKRWRRFRSADVPVWRTVHAVLGAATLLLFFLHTGLSAGTRVNLVLAIDFLAVVLLGALAGGVFAVSSRWSPLAARNRRLRASSVHLFLTWPLPILVALHVLAVYYY
ncbi:FAD-dependent oxidoreductase [Polyangium sorediatum]|uniref:FAD-dependent oxidoreductase n=1 Tax=Polyangium sorediatum TaxID=889274 RepID=A0ABT6NNF8_9BACT|nr:FAD-dependent oxidoreductase [Polyangium sorediatum]MDI1429867.1 FAD-dependent oxidoreductase [Polyangium sorediatum]